MKLILNEQEVIDSVCVWMNPRHPERVDVEDLSFDERDGFSATALTSTRSADLDEQDIKNGIARLLQEYYSFNPDNFVVNLNFTEGVGIWAEVLVNES